MISGSFAENDLQLIRHSMGLRHPPPCTLGYGGGLMSPTYRLIWLMSATYRLIWLMSTTHRLIWLMSPPYPYPSLSLSLSYISTHFSSISISSISIIWRSRLLHIIGLFCRISSLLWGSFAKEYYNFRELEYVYFYGGATIGRLLQIPGLFLHIHTWCLFHSHTSNHMT